MKMIEVLDLMAKGKIKEGTKLKIGYKIYDYIKDYTESENCSFVNREDDRTEFLEDNEFITTDFLNKEVELIAPKPKEYLVKINIRGLQGRFAYLNYCGTSGRVNLHDRYKLSPSIQTEFTKQELQSIQPVREFLEDMQGKYELIEVEDNEDY